jgi:hypothetical protein
MHKQPPKAMTQLPPANHIGTAPRVPVAMDTTELHRGQVEAMKSMRQVDRAISRKLNAADQLGNIPSCNSMLD